MISGLQLLFVFAALVSTYKTLAQDSTIRPIRHSLPFGGVQSLDGSLPNGGCTSVNDDGNTCNLQDGGTSVLVDNTILPLNGLNGDWARDLYTVNRTSGPVSFISIGFNFGTSVRVERVELVLFNCQQRSIRAGSIQIYTDAVTNIFPRQDPTSVGNLVGDRPLGVGTNSCEDLYRVCVPLTGAANVRNYYIVFPSASGSNRVYLAETIFYTDTRTCGPDTLVTEPVTTPPVDTTTEEDNGSEQTMQTDTTTQAVTTQAENTPTTTTTSSCPSTTVDVNSATIALIVTVVMTITLATVIVVLHIPLYVRYRSLLTASTSHQNVTKESISSRNNKPLPAEDVTYEQIDETKFGRTEVDLKQNEAYGLSRVTG